MSAIAAGFRQEGAWGVNGTGPYSSFSRTKAMAPVGLLPP